MSPTPSEARALQAKWRRYAFRVLEDYLRARPWLVPHREEMEGEALLGLAEAATTFEAGRGNFATHARWGVFGRLTRYSQSAKRQESRHIALEAPLGPGEEGPSLAELLAGETPSPEEDATREALPGLVLEALARHLHRVRGLELKRARLLARLWLAKQGYLPKGVQQEEARRAGVSQQAMHQRVLAFSRDLSRAFRLVSERLRAEGQRSSQ